MRTRSELDDLFADIAPALDGIASRRNLLIEKYHHEQPVWCLCFEHPSGGQAKIEVHLNDPTVALVTSNRWLDDYDAAVRYIRWGEMQKFALPDDALSSRIEGILDGVLAWNKDDWSQKAEGFQPFWHRRSKAEFLRLSPHWPKANYRSAQQDPAGEAENPRRSAVPDLQN